MSSRECTYLVMKFYLVGTGFSINFPESTNTQRKKKIMRHRSAVWPIIVLHLHLKQRFVVKLYAHQHPFI